MKLLYWIPFEKLQWDELSRNPNAIHLLEQNLEKIHWWGLSKNPGAIHLLEANPEKIYWCQLTKNPNAIHIIKKNPEKFEWWWLSQNPSIFEEDYQTLCKERTEVLREELMEKTWHPLRMRSWCLEYDDEFVC